MKATDTLLEYDYYRRYFNNHDWDVHKVKDLIGAGAQALNAATNNDKELVLTASEQIALSVKQKGSYDISEREAKKNLRELR